MDKFKPNALHNVVILIHDGQHKVEMQKLTMEQMEYFIRGFFHAVYADMNDPEFVHWEVLEDLISRWKNTTEDEFQFDYKEMFDLGLIVKFSTT